MKIKELPGYTNLRGVKFKHPETGEICIWYSQWLKGVWYKKPNDSNLNKVYPLCLDDLKEALEFEVVEPVNQ